MIEHLLWITDEKEGAGRMYYRRPSAGIRVGVGVEYRREKIRIEKRR